MATKKDTLVTFTKQPELEKTYSSGLNLKKLDTKNVFSIPYSKIMMAESFCVREGLTQCLVGHRDNDWVIQVTDKNITHDVIVTPTGIQDKRYIYMFAQAV